MKKSSAKGYIILGILFVLVSVIVFAVPSVKTMVFWISYIFTVVAFVVQIIIWKVALGRDKDLNSKFLGLPVIHIGIIYLVIQIIELAVFLFVPALPVWSAIVACVIIAGTSAVCMISAEVGYSEIERLGDKVHEKVFYIKELQAEVELLANAETDVTTETALRQLAEKIRFSDPMSDARLTDLESRITDKIAELKSSDDKAVIIDEINSFIDERNMKTKILKCTEKGD